MTHNTSTVRVKLLSSLLDKLNEDFPAQSLSETLNQLLLEHFDAKGKDNDI